MTKNNTSPTQCAWKPITHATKNMYPGHINWGCTKENFQHALTLHAKMELYKNAKYGSAALDLNQLLSVHIKKWCNQLFMKKMITSLIRVGHLSLPFTFVVYLGEGLKSVRSQGLWCFVGNMCPKKATEDPIYHTWGVCVKWRKIQAGIFGLLIGIFEIYSFLKERVRSSKLLDHVGLIFMVSHVTITYWL